MDCEPNDLNSAISVSPAGSVWEQCTNPHMHVAEDFSLGLKLQLSSQCSEVLHSSAWTDKLQHCIGTVMRICTTQSAEQKSQFSPCVWGAPVSGTLTRVLVTAALPACAARLSKCRLKKQGCTNHMAFAHLFVWKFQIRGLVGFKMRFSFPTNTGSRWKRELKC